MNICDSRLDTLHAALGGRGLFMDLGSATVRVCSGVPTFARQMQTAYRAFPMQTDAEFSDLHVELRQRRGPRRFLRRQALFLVDGIPPFEPFPSDTALPLFEWGVNWCIAMRLNQYLLLHAGVVERCGKAIILAALPGSGKSTLTAALMLSGYRLLSDEFGVVRLDTGELQAMLKPVALKNRSIDVIREYSPDGHIGQTFPKTRKGDVAHLAPDAASVAKRSQRSQPALILFPRFEANAQLRVEPMSQSQTFARLSFNSFNYTVLGPDGFDAVHALVTRCPAFDLRYGSLEQAISWIDSMLGELTHNITFSTDAAAIIAAE